MPAGLQKIADERATVALSTSHSHKQFEAPTEQARELTTLAQKVVSATAMELDAYQLADQQKAVALKDWGGLGRAHLQVG
jgi:hypothetical protein